MFLTLGTEDWPSDAACPTYPLWYVIDPNDVDARFGFEEAPDARTPEQITPHILDETLNGSWSGVPVDLAASSSSQHGKTSLCRDVPIVSDFGSILLTAMTFQYKTNLFVSFELRVTESSAATTHRIACTDLLAHNKAPMHAVKDLITICPWHRRVLGLASIEQMR